MISIQIKNLGPLIDTGIVFLSQFNVIIGKQSTGKSTFMKILSYCQWLEKKIMTDTENQTIKNYTHNNRFIKELKQFHNFNDGFFSSISEIHYCSDVLYIDLYSSSKNVKIEKSENFEAFRHNVKNCFIPSERNLVSAIKNIDNVYKTSKYDYIINHILEWGEAKEHISEEHPIDLSFVGNMQYYYSSKKNDVIKLKDKGITISPCVASSGVQSVLPIAVMAEYFTSKEFLNKVLVNKIDLTEFFKRYLEDNNLTLSKELFTRKFEQYSNLKRYMATNLFIEEPEQNLFPISQQELMKFLVEKINSINIYDDWYSSLTVTTHSPYIITAFNLMMKAHQALKANSKKTSQLITNNIFVDIDKIQAYYIESGRMHNIVDEELNMISGVDLDKASDLVEDQFELLDNIIYEKL